MRAFNLCDCPRRVDRTLPTFLFIFRLIASFIIVPANNDSVVPCLLHVTLGCQKQLRDVPLVRGILADLNILFKDIIRAVESTLREATCSSDDLTVLGSSYTQDLQWICNLDLASQATFREAFLSCCLNDGATETRNHLLFLCNRLKLSTLLESLTDDC
ncbi:hypothetical protein P879_11352 [Paragonimus westermani]|uniref:Uncharacterized protein n=1 Tax=Paragonimus westermani TaxID=34504 RepID=A0A8T0D820_9TREM|nr:hypothetical protein P879_11352 [Paragonimus westermani]